MQASEIFGYIVFTHIPNSFLFGLKFPQFLLLLCCLLFHLELSFTLFSFQGAASNLFQGQISVSKFLWVLKSNLGGPKWTRTTDLTIISRVL